MRELFIYYRIRVDEARTARDAVETMQSGLSQRHPGLTGRLLRRPDEHDQQQTWMEIYAMQRDGEPVGVTAQVEADIADAAATLARFIVGTRHVEAFVPCAS